MAFGNGPRQASHFPAKLEVIAPRRDAIGVPDRDHRKAQRKRDQDDEPDGVPKRMSFYARGVGCDLFFLKN